MAYKTRGRARSKSAAYSGRSSARGTGRSRVAGKRASGTRSVRSGRSSPQTLRIEVISRDPGPMSRPLPPLMGMKPEEKKPPRKAKF